MVLLKGADERGFAFYTNHDSRKGRELAANPRAALVLYWQALGRQVRVEGRVERGRLRRVGGVLGDAAAREPRVGLGVAAERAGARAATSSRSAARGSRRRDFAGEDVPLPPHWGGYRVCPESIELWEHRDDRLHDRVLYTREGDGWRMERLAP